MIVVINPSGSAGFSFKGLHAYCSHDVGQDSADRLEWTSSRNLASDNPEHGWRVMAATAMAQGQLKEAAGIKATGRKSSAHVQHIVLSFHEDEPQSREDMEAAADALLTKLGSDPSKSRGKTKAGQKQFADEHQAIYYAHGDTGNRHLHVMVNRVHPEHGVMLPSKNDQLKASKWAQAYSQEHGTDHATPNREINNDARDKGEYVKAERRKTRNVYEQAHEPANDNRHAAVIERGQAKKDAALALRGRNMALQHRGALERQDSAHKERLATLARAQRRDRNAAVMAVREEFRPQWQQLKTDQAAEKKAFEALEGSFFGRMKNAATTIGLAKHIREGGLTGAIKRSFNVTTREGDRRAVFEQAQEARRKALERDQDKKAGSAVQKVKDAYTDGKSRMRGVFLEERGRLVARQAGDRDALKQSWRARNKEREAAWTRYQAVMDKRGEAKSAFDRAAGGPSKTYDAEERGRKAALLARYARAARSKSPNDKTPANDRGRRKDRDRGDRER